MSVFIMYHRSDSLIPLEVFVVLFFKPLSSFMTYGNFPTEFEDIIGTNLSNLFLNKILTETFFFKF
jgi:hypothetical protein